ncbi:LysM peptidoglycan-binding domain-containing protein [Streptococcus sp. CF7_Ac1-8]|uniref:LysM peptidoglycan-binding domain-containing protein n=2 Tax=unclassified Streptococcus TaxID=2608887 RepID=UPI0020C912CF|nr:LysM peptidoglycan-binding domain-containing protein [Streptococcus sp. CF7_Ac1-8]MCP9084345.1 LysM peptidoglycan-binding domain-containing protein [Streptococcus sp. CF7_Ac1-8]
MRQTNVRGSLSLRGFRKLRTGAIVATGVILLGLGFLAPTVSANEQDGVWVARTVAEVKADIQNINNLSHYTIKWGDTLSAISGATGLSVDSLVEINRIANRDLIFANNKLYFSEEAFLKDGNTEVKRQQVSIDNSGSRQSYEVETKTDTVTGEQTTTVKQTTPVVVETPAVSAPKSETSVSVAPKEETPSTPAPKVEEPATPAPKEETPSTPAPKVEEPSTPAPKAEEPVTPAPKEETPSTPAPKEETPATPEPKAEEPSTPAPKAEEPSTPAPKEETPSTPAPKVEEPSTPAPKVEEPSTPAPKAEEPVTPAPKEETPSTPAPKEETPSTPAPKVEEPATPAPKEETPSTPAPKAEEPATPAPKEETPSTPAPKEETPSTPAPKVEEPATPAPKEETPATPEPKAEEPSTPAPKEETPATPAPKAEEPVTPEPKTEEEKLLEETKQDSIRENIDAVVNIKLAEIEKIENPDEKEKLKEKLYELRKNAVDDIKNAKDEEEALILTEKHQNIINSLEISGEKYTKPNFDKDNLSNGRNDGTTIEGGSTAIGHGSGEAPSGATQPASAEGTDNSSAPTAQPQPETTSSGTSSFRNAPSVQARARRVARSTSEPDGTVNISYNFAGMPDIHGFLSDPGEDNTVTIPAGTSEAQAKELVKEKIQAKIKDLAARGYYVKNDIIFEQDTTVKNYNYVVTFTKEATGTSGFRMAPAVQPRASRNRRSLEQPAPQKVKVNVFYNFDKMKDIAGFLGDINGTPLEIAEGSTDDQVKAAVKNQVDAKKEELRKRGYTVKEDYLSKNNGKDYNYVVTFTKEATGTSGFRMAPAVQPRASRNRRSLEQPAPQKVKVNVFYNFDKMKDIAGFLGDINGTSLEIAEGLSTEQVKAAVKSQVDAKKEELSKRGYTFKEDYVYQANGKDYNYVVTFSKATK